MFANWQKLGNLALVAALALPVTAQTSAPTASGKPQVVAKVATKAGKPAKRGKQSAAKRIEPEPVAEQTPPTPPPPSRPYEMSPVPPQVTYTNGQLTISAPNSTLADIMSQVRARIG